MDTFMERVVQNMKEYDNTTINRKKVELFERNHKERSVQITKTYERRKQKDLFKNRTEVKTSSQDGPYEKKVVKLTQNSKGRQDVLKTIFF